MTDQTVERLPIEPWEVVERRFELPHDLQNVLGLPVSTTRVPAQNDKKILTKHARDQAQYERLSYHLRSWQKAGPEVETGKWDVFFYDNGRWFIVVIGRSRTGSYNLITVYSSDDTAYFARRWQRGLYVDRERS